jgi:hypothetical protein
VPLKLENRLGVQAPAEVIWPIMSDLATWQEWNPLYPKAAGIIRIGEILTLDLALPGQPVQTIQPRVLDWAPLDHIHWQLKLLRGLVTSVRYLEIEIMGDASCIVSNGELFTGPLSFLVRSQRRAIRQGFDAMGEAIKTRAEAAWAAQQAQGSTP